MSKKLPNAWQAHWITPAVELDSHPILFKQFKIEHPISTAKLFMTGLGLFEVYLNGEKLGDEVLSPFFDDYDTRVQVLSFDVADKLQEENLLEIWLGNGWYRGRFGMVPRANRWGSELCAIAQLEITDAAGKAWLLCSDETWRCKSSPVLSSGIYDGEQQDYTGTSEDDFPVKKSNRDTGSLSERTSAPLRITAHRFAERILHTPKGETVLDFGQNFAGWVEVNACQNRGTGIHLDFGEILIDGNFYNENYRSGAGGFSFRCDGRRRVYHPHFTYFGFRYVKVSGWEGELTGKEFTGCVIHSDLPRSGWFECGHDGVNRLYENILWSQWSNFVDIPTDCPQRDERLPWSGDAQIFARTACYNMDCRRFYPHYLDLMRSDQVAHGGGIANYLPRDPVLSEPCAIWGDAAIEIPMALYDHYGDPALLERYFPMMAGWAEYLARQDEARGGRWLCDKGFQFGDWLALDGVTESSFKGATEDCFVATMYWHHSVAQLARAAEILGKEQEQKRYWGMAESIRSALLKEYFTPSGRLAIDTQTAYLLCLRFGIYTDRERIIANLLERLQKDCWQLTSGFAAAPLLCSVLAVSGLEKAALRMLLNRNYPGWLYEVEQGATTIWERWNSLLPNGSVNPSGMNSFNHFSYGSVGQFLYEHIAGLKGTKPGFKEIRFAPCVDVRLGWCRAVYDSAAGQWESAWHIYADGSLEVSLTVPAGCTAEVALPYSDTPPFAVGEGVFSATYKPVANVLTPYSGESLLSELAAYPGTRAVLEKLAPQAVPMGLFGDRATKAMTLSQFCQLPFMGITSQQAEELLQAISSTAYEIS